MEVPFGKYQGLCVEDILEDEWYCLWILGKQKIKEKYPEFYERLSNLCKAGEYDDSNMVMPFG